MLDPNVNIQASKVSAVDIRPGRRPRGADRVALVREYQKRAGLDQDTGTVLHDGASSEAIRQGQGETSAAKDDPTKDNMSDQEG